MAPKKSDATPPQPIAPPPPPSPAKSKHLLACESQIDKVTLAICDAMFVDTLPEARKLMDEQRNDLHVQNLRDVRGELEYLLKRKKQLEAAS